MNPHAGFITVHDPHDPRIAIYRDQRDQWRRARHRAWLEGRAPDPGSTGTGLDPAHDPSADLFIAEGEKVVAQLLDSPHQFVSAMMCVSRAGASGATVDRAAARGPVYLVPRDVIDGIAGFEVHRGLLAVGRRVDPGGAASLLARSACCVILEDLANHDNVGGIFRSVRALCPPRAGWEFPACVLLSPRCCDPLYRKALRVSMGNTLHVPYATLEPWPGALGLVKAAGFDVLMLDPGAGSVDLRAIWTRRPALVLGTEGPGLSAEVRGNADKFGICAARVPIDPGADSLNVGVAAAIALHRLCAWPV